MSRKRPVDEWRSATSISCRSIRSCSISIRQHTSAYGDVWRSATSISADCLSIRPCSISIRQHTLQLYQHTSACAPALSAYVRIRQRRASLADVCGRRLYQHTSARIRSCSINICPHTSATSIFCLSIRTDSISIHPHTHTLLLYQHTSAYVSDEHVLPLNLLLLIY